MVAKWNHEPVARQNRAALATQLDAVAQLLAARPHTAQELASHTGLHLRTVYRVVASLGNRVLVRDVPRSHGLGRPTTRAYYLSGLDGKAASQATLLTPATGLDFGHLNKALSSGAAHRRSAVSLLDSISHEVSLPKIHRAVAQMKKLLVELGNELQRAEYAAARLEAAERRRRG